MSLKLKIFGGISLIVALLAIILVVLLMPGNSKTELNGYWTFEPNQFFGFITKDGKQFLEYGLFESSYGISGEIINTEFAGEYEMALTIYVPAKQATEMEDAQPEKIETIYIDISHFNLDGRINVKIENLGDGEWHTYNYGGDTFESAYTNR